MTPGSVPPAHNLTTLDASQMRELLRQRNLPSDATWWTVVISVCNSGMIGAEAGLADAEEWAEVLVEALDTSVRTGGLPQEEVLHRRVIACAAAIKYFGVQKDNPTRDPELVLNWLFGQVGNSLEVLLEQCHDVAASATDPTTGRPRYKEIKWLQSIKLTLHAVCDLIADMGEGPPKLEAIRWCAAASSVAPGRIPST